MKLLLLSVSLFLILYSEASCSENLPVSPNAKLTTGLHGGNVHRLKTRYYEVVGTDHGIRIFLYDANGKSLLADKIRGTVDFKIAGNQKIYRYGLYPDSKHHNCLYLAIDLSKTDDAKVDMNFTIARNASNVGDLVTFSQTLSKTISEASIASVQKICLVSSKNLGSMGKPLPAIVDGKTVLVCCAGCLTPLKKSPETYMPRLKASYQFPEKSTVTDKAAIQKQKQCPVMDEPLMSMGVPWKIYVKKQAVFVCCKGCIKKVHQQPDYYLEKSQNR